MNFTEVKREYKQRDGGFQVFPFAAETVGQAGKSAHPHPDREVGSFNVRRANHIPVRVAEPRFNDRALEFGRTVARRAVSHASVNLNQLTIVNTGAKAQANGVRVSAHAVCGQLELSRRGLIQLLNENLSINAGASAKVPSEDDLAMALDSEERPSIALALVIRVALIPFLAIAKSPQLIGLYVFHGHFADLLLQNALALLASDFQDTQDGRDRYVAQSRRAANATTLAQTIENAIEFFVRQVDRFARLNRARRERPATLAASKARRSILSVIAVRLRGIDVTSWAIHLSPASFLTQDTAGNTIWLRPVLASTVSGQVKSPRRVLVALSSGSHVVVPATRLERVTLCLVGSRSIQLSYAGTIFQTSSSRLLLNTLKRRNFRYHWLERLPAIHRLAVSARDTRYFAALMQSFQDRVNARECVRVSRQVVALQQERVAHFYGCPILIGRLKHFAQSISKLEVVDFAVKRSTQRFAEYGFAGQFRKACYRLLQLKNALLDRLSFQIDIGLSGVNHVSLLNQLEMFVAGSGKSLVPVHNGGYKPCTSICQEA